MQIQYTYWPGAPRPVCPPGSLRGSKPIEGYKPLKIMNSDENKLKKYKDDLKRFQNLKAAVKLRYAEAIDYRDYEPKIKKLLDTHIQANEVTQLNEPVNIFDEKMFNMVKEDQGVYQTKTTASKADTIAHATKRSISENMDEDPAFYEKFSKLIQAFMMPYILIILVYAFTGQY